MEHPGSIDEVLRGQADAILTRHDQQLKESLLQGVVMPNLHLLKAGSQARWNEPNWYTGLDGQSLAAMLARLGLPPEPFAVPADCGYWYPTETDSVTNLPFRFFQQRAWLDLPLPHAPCTFSFAAPFAVMDAAVQGLRVYAAGHEVALERAAPGNGSRALFFADVSADTLRAAAPEGLLRLHFCCDIVAVPALLYPGSADRRRLSMAITFPSFK